MNRNIGLRPATRPARNKPRRQRGNARQRRLGAECLEHRILLAADTLAWHNADFPEDVNGDQAITSMDALLVINDLNRAGPRPVDESPPTGMIDVTGDGFVSSRDALRVINALNAGEGEEHESVRIRLAVTPVDSMAPLSSLGPNEDFMLRTYVQDLTERTGISGVFAAYLDVLYDASLVQVASGETIEFSPPYTTSRSGSVDTAGLIDEAGAADGIDPLGLEERLLFSVPMRSGDGPGTASFVGEPADMFPAHDTLLYDFDDPIPTSDIEYAGTSLQILVGAAPVAVDDTFNGVEDQIVIVMPDGVLSNDSDEDGDDLTAILVTPPSAGELELRPDGSFVYRPDENFNGTDSFMYVANDGANDSAPATVTLVIEPVNDAPIVEDESYVTEPNAPLVVSSDEGVLENDFDVEGSPITAVVTRSTSNGSLILNDDGSFTYTPAEGFLGEDSFDYVVSDGERSSVVSTATILVTENQDPVAEDDSYTTMEDTSLSVPAPGILDNDRHPGGDSLTAVLVTEPMNGMLALQEDGSFDYTPLENFHGTDQFIYTASDGEVSSDPATVTITVTPVNDAPIAQDDRYRVVIDTPLEVDFETGLLANDVDVDNDKVDLTVQVLEDVATGTLEVAPDGSFTYTPASGFRGEVTFVYDVTDGLLTSDPATVTLDVGTGGPEVTFRLATTDSAGNVLSEVSVGDRFELRVFVRDVGAPPNNGVFAAFTDVTFDAALAMPTGPIEHAAPYDNGTSGDISTAGLIDEAGGFDGLDPLGDSERLVFSVPMQATAGGDLTLTADPADATPAHFVLTFDSVDPIPTDQIDYGETTLTILGRTRPIAVDDAYFTPDNTRLEVSQAEGVLANDSAVAGEELSASLVQDVEQGELQLNADGSFVYTPDAGFIGNDVFTYVAMSEAASSEPATVTITVGDLAPSSISGSVYFDVNNNGRRDAVEQPLGGVVVRLTGTDLFEESVELTTRTARDGRYSFDGLFRGNYVIAQEQPAIVVDGIDAQAGMPSATNNEFVVDLAPDTDGSGYDFGERGLRPEYIRHMDFFASANPEGASAAIGPDGSQSWYHLSAGWEDYRSVEMSLSNDRSSLTISAVDVSGNAFGATVSVLGNARVQLRGNPLDGFLVKLRGTSADFSLEPMATNAPAAVDAVFAGP